MKWLGTDHTETAKYVFSNAYLALSRQLTSEVRNSILTAYKELAGVCTPPQSVLTDEGNLNVVGFFYF